MAELETTWPCEWVFRIVGTDEERIRELAAEALPGRPFALDTSRQSAGGRYVSMHLRVELRDEADRDRVFGHLAADASVRMVL